MSNLKLTERSRVSVCVHERLQHIVPRSTFGKVDEGRKNDHDHANEEGEGEQGVGRELDGDPHHLNGEDDGVGVSEGSEDPEESEGSENRKSEHDGLVKTGEEGSSRSEAARDEKTEDARRNRDCSTHRVIVEHHFQVVGEDRKKVDDGEEGCCVVPEH